jgi:hypothetical protein
VQFGRLHGVALIVLGIVLLGVQATISMTPKSAKIPAETSPTVSEHKTTWFPGIIGTVSLLAGVGLFVTASRRDEPPSEHAVK